MELLFGIYGRCFLAVGDILWVYFELRKIYLCCLSLSLYVYIICTVYNMCTWRDEAPKVAELRPQRWDNARLILCFETSRTVGAPNPPCLTLMKQFLVCGSGETFMFWSEGGTWSWWIKVAKSGSKLVCEDGLASSLHADFLQDSSKQFSLELQFNTASGFQW